MLKQYWVIKMLNLLGIFVLSILACSYELKNEKLNSFKDHVAILFIIFAVIMMFFVEVESQAKECDVWKGDTCSYNELYYYRRQIKE